MKSQSSATLSPSLHTFGSSLREVYSLLSALLSPSHHLLVGVSGGADSMVLLHLLSGIEVRLTAVHCHFHLRAEESDRDEEFVRSILQDRYPWVGCDFVHFDTIAYAKQRGVSIEMAARELRYAHFRRLLSELGANYIAVGHHADDQVETILLNLIRGTGGRGLVGMTPVTPPIIRPLLGVSKGDILHYCDEQRLDYVTDSSNERTEYRRNRIRHLILPQLRKLNPSFDASLLSSQEIWREEQGVIATEVDRFVEQYYDKRLHRLCLYKATRHPHASVMLYRWLSPAGFTADTISDIARRDPTGRALFYSTDKTEVCEIFRGFLYRIPPVRKSPSSSDYGFTTDRTAHTVLQCSLPHSYSLSQISIRAARASDRFAPFGMKKGRRKLFDYLKDKGIPVSYRDQVPVLVHREEVIAVLPLQIAECVRMQGGERQTLFINWKASDTNPLDQLLDSLKGEIRD